MVKRRGAMTSIGDICIKTEQVDAEYDRALQLGKDNLSIGYSDESSQASEAEHGGQRTAESSQSLRGYLSNIIKDKSREISVKGIIEDLLEKNETLLAQNDALLYKPHPRTPRTDTSLKNKSEPTTKTKLLNRDDFNFQPNSPSIICKETPQSLDIEIVSTMDDNAEVILSSVDREITCGIASKALAVTDTGMSFQFNDHMQTFWCNFCPFQTGVKELLLQHVMDHRFHCKTCNYGSFSRANVIRHAAKSHADFSETAKTLKYCFFSADCEQAVENTRKRKGVENDSVQKSKKKRSKKHTVIDNGNSSVECLFDMEVEEVQEDNAYENNRDSEPLKVVTPKLVKKEQSAITQTMTTNATALFSNEINTEGTDSSSLSTGSLLSGTSKNQVSSPGQGGSNLKATGLCWNCGYCDFVTLSQTILKAHLNTHHTGKAHKYVAMLMSSVDELARIKEKDENLFQTASAKFMYVNVSQTPAMAALSNSKAALANSEGMGQLNVEETLQDPDSDEEYLPEEEKRKYPLTYKCAHCNFNAPVSYKVKDHLQSKHNGCVLYSLDMRAVKLKQKRYVFFCHRKNCSFTTKKTEEYLSHSLSCTPWLDPNCPEINDVATKKSLEMTRNFSYKLSRKNVQTAASTKTQTKAEFACVYCNYTSDNNTRVKKHVLSNHTDNETVMKDMFARKMRKKMYIYFCKHCFWETRNDVDLSIHLQERHDDLSIVTPVVMPEAPEDSEQAENDISFSMEVVSGLSKDSLPVEGSGLPEYPAQPSAASTDEEDDNFDDLDLQDDQIRYLMDLYVNDEASREGSSPGRPTRNAAAKAQIRFKAQGQFPQLFKCIHCSQMNFGVNLMRKHMLKKHPSEDLCAIDLKKKRYNQQVKCFFCPKDGCKFNSVREEDVINHSMEEHGLDSDEKHLKLSEKNMSSHSKRRIDLRYKCIYCKESVLSSTMEEMRQHLAESHPMQDVLFCDAVAKRSKRASKIYMCERMDCQFSTINQRQYNLHKFAHAKETIHECLVCQWFTVDPALLKEHIASVHPDEAASAVSMKLELDDSGEVVNRKVESCVIKKEVE